jgi:hypothetical protein
MNFRVVLVTGHQGAALRSRVENLANAPKYSIDHFPSRVNELHYDYLNIGIKA